ncbi:MAG: SUF system Fe-S cluster assembly regulator [Sandaracinaceae bacterium]
MLRISRLADYGVVLATRLALLEEGQLRSVRTLAEDTGIPQPTVSKILKALGRSLVVTSIRGAHGGYRLARAPEDTSVAEVIVALEGPIGVTECVRDDEEPGCDLQGRCEVHGNWNRINEVLDRALRDISLAEMAQPAPPVLITLGLGRPSTPPSDGRLQAAGSHESR